jgi:hypothetical protein
MCGTSKSWRGIRVAAFERKQCEVIRGEIDAEHGHRHYGMIKQAEARIDSSSRSRSSGSRRCASNSLKTMA